MAVNIDWGLASTPNILGAYTGAREKAEQNALLREQAAAQVQQTARVNAREDTRLTMEQQKATRDQGTADAASWQKAAQAVGHLKGVLGTGGPDAAVQAFHDIAPGLGLPPDQVEQMGAALARDPKGFLDHVGALSEQKLQAINRGNGGYDVVDLNNNGAVVRGVAPTAEYKSFKPDENVYQVGGDPTPAGAPQAAAGKPPAPTGGVYDQVANVATQSGGQPQDVGYLQRLAQVESSGNPKATNGKSTGVFQFHPDTFAGVGGKDINDVGDQTKAALALSQRDRQLLTQNHIEPTDANTYIMHQQGAGGGKALLTAPPETNAIAALTPVYGSEKMARKAIVNNGGTTDMTAGQFVDMWRQKWDGGAQQAPAQAGGAPAGLKLVQAAQPAAGDETALSPDAISLMAGRYLKDGTLPSLGQGKASVANRAAIINAATKQANALGITAEDLVAGNLSVKAAGAALSKATQQRTAVESFENTALKNADLMLTLAPKGGGQTNSPAVNRWLQAGRKQIAGDPDVANFDIALGTFADEYAKIVSGATGAQGSTDASRREAYDRLSKYATQGQLQGGIATMKQEMHNRITSMRDTEDGLRQQIRNGGGAESPAPPAATARTSAVETRKAMTPAQRSQAGRFAGSKDPVGAAGNPYVTVTEAQYKNLPSGAHYLFTDGKVLVKP